MKVCAIGHEGKGKRPHPAHVIRPQLILQHFPSCHVEKCSLAKRIRLDLQCVLERIGVALKE